MHKFTFSGALVALLVSSGLAQPTLAANGELDRMSWITGFWVSGPNAVGTVHQFTFEPAFNGELMGTSMEVDKDGKVFHHAVRSIHEKDGKLIFQDTWFLADMAPTTTTYPLRELESQDATHVNFTDMKLTSTGKNTMRMEIFQHPQGQAMKTTVLDLKRTMAFVPVKP